MYNINFDINGKPINQQLNHYKKYIVFSKKADALYYLHNYNWRSGLKLFSEDVNNIGAKRFILSTKEDICDLVTSTHAHVYENIEQRDQVKLHIDIDYKTRISERYKLDILFNRLIKLAIDIVNKELIPFKVINPKIIILRSNMVINKNSENKISGHIIYTNVVFENISHMKTFFLSIKSDLIDNKTIDKSIYRTGCFRMFSCSKKSKNNKLKFFKGINYNKPTLFNQLFNDCLVSEITENNYYLITPFSLDIREVMK